MMGVSRKPNSRDVEIGRDLARQRKAAGTSQAAMAAALGISTQQYGKYERGENQISTSRYEQALGVLHGIQGAVQPGLAEERATYQAQDALLLELESAALALRPALDRFLAAVESNDADQGFPELRIATGTAPVASFRCGGMAAGACPRRPSS